MKDAVPSLSLWITDYLCFPPPRLGIIDGARTVVGDDISALAFRAVFAEPITFSTTKWLWREDYAWPISSFAILPSSEIVK